MTSITETLTDAPSIGLMVAMIKKNYGSFTEYCARVPCGLLRPILVSVSSSGQRRGWFLRLLGILAIPWLLDEQRGLKIQVEEEMVRPSLGIPRSDKY